MKRNSTTTAPGSGLKIFGQQLFTTYLLPLQVTGFLLLMAMIGVIVLGRKQQKTEAKEA
jgi:NADH-quinone oxidoreductase subunit J